MDRQKSSINLMPKIGYGTYPLTGEKCQVGVSAALDEGYRLIDTATFYKNLSSIGHAIKEFPRQDLFLVSKIWPLDQGTPASIHKDFHTALEELQTDYLDLYLLHWPNSQTSFDPIVRTMMDLKNNGQVKYIGLSNVTLPHVQRALDRGFDVAVVQNEMHPLFHDEALNKFCDKMGIKYQAWSPINRGKIQGTPLIEELSKKYSVSMAQLALKWIVQRGCIPLPSSSQPLHIKENIDLDGFTISETDMASITQLASSGKRLRITKEFNLGFEDEFDFEYKDCWPN